MLLQLSQEQTAVWNQSLSPQMNIPSPVGNGWILEGKYKILWMTLPATPDSLLEIVNCTCKSGCKTQSSDLCFVKADII